jgi:peptide/nickel transport system permease protein
MQNCRKIWLDRVEEEEPIRDDQIIDEVITEEKVYVASYAQLMWWRFLKHRMAVISAVIVIFLYLVAAFAEFVAPYDPEHSFVVYRFMTPTAVRIVDAGGNWQRPFIYGTIRDRDPATLRNIYVEDTSVIYPIRFFVEGPEYKMWNLWPMNRHLIGIDAPWPIKVSSSWGQTAWAAISSRAWSTAHVSR